jgi:signal transduction histidine kinase
MAEDLSNLRQEFEQLTAARGRMLREAAHDLRGGLSAVVAASDVLKLSTEGDQSLSGVLETMDRGIRSVSEMLESLLDLSRLEAGADPPDRRLVDIAEVLTELVRQHGNSAAEKGLALRWEGPESLWLCTDPGKVRRIAQNLLVNALQHTRRGEVRVSCARGEDRWVLEVADTGPGIQDVSGSAVARELNHPDRGQSPPAANNTLSYTGEGIGLTIVKRLCEVLDAGISLDSEPGKGTSFRVELPLDEAGAQRC